MSDIRTNHHGSAVIYRSLGELGGLVASPKLYVDFQSNVSLEVELSSFGGQLLLVDTNAGYASSHFNQTFDCGERFNVFVGQNNDQNIRQRTFS